MWTEGQVTYSSCNLLINTYLLFYLTTLTPTSHVLHLPDTASTPTLIYPPSIVFLTPSSSMNLCDRTDYGDTPDLSFFLTLSHHSLIPTLHSYSLTGSQHPHRYTTPSIVFLTPSSSMNLCAWHLLFPHSLITHWYLLLTPHSYSLIGSRHPHRYTRPQSFSLLPHLFHHINKQTHGVRSHSLSHLHHTYITPTTPSCRTQLTYFVAATISCLSGTYKYAIFRCYHNLSLSQHIKIP